MVARSQDEQDNQRLVKISKSSGPNGQTGGGTLGSNPLSTSRSTKKNGSSEVTQVDVPQTHSTPQRTIQGK